MNERNISRFAVAVLLAGAGLMARTAEAQTTGSIKGKVTDEATGDPLAGVTVSVAGPALQGEQTEFTDESGSYIITALPPGEYLVRFYFANIVAERPGVVIRSEQTLSLSVAMRSKEASTQTYTITERAPTVDVGSTQVVTQVTNEMVRNTPIRGRTYEAVLALAPGSATDGAGASFAGATGPENSYLLDGLNTTDNGYGLVGTPLTLEFLEETNIITAGYRAEYGRATGGVVSLVTKSGSNEVKGSLWLNGQTSLVDPPVIARNGEAIGSIRSRSFRAADFGFEVGGPIIKDRIWFYAGVAPNIIIDRYQRFVRTRLADSVPDRPLDANGDGTPDCNDLNGNSVCDDVEVYAGDEDTGAECPGYIASADASNGGDSSLCVGPGRLDPSRRPANGYLTREVPGTRRILDSDSKLLNYIGKLDLRFSDDHRMSLAYIGSPSTFQGVYENPRNPNTLNLNFNADPNIMNYSEDMGVHDVIARLESKLFDRKLQVRLTGGFHSQFDDVVPRAQGAGTLRDNRVLSITTFEDVADCEARAVSGGMFAVPCPTEQYLSNGFGFYNTLTNQRFAVALDATYFAEALGTHAIKFGADYENNRFRDQRAYTGDGRYQIYPDDHAWRRQYGTVDEKTKEVQLLSSFTADTRTANEAFYLQDSYSASFVPGLTVDLGVRWELQQIKDIDGNTAIGIDDNISPRIGLIYDWTQRGLSKLFANYGRFYESIPLDINDRAFSREGLVTQTLAKGDPGYCQADEKGKIDVTTCRFPSPTREDSAGGDFTPIQPDLGGMYSDQFTFGLEQDVGYDLVLGAAYIHKALGRVIEDVSYDGANNYVIANPGHQVDPEVLANLQRQVAAAQASVDSATDDAARERAELSLGRANSVLLSYRDIATYPEATRVYNAAVLTARKRFTNNFQMLASYTYSRTIGNYPGLFQSSNGQLDPNISTQYDIKDLLANRDGPLPNDRPHNLKFIGSYFLPIGSKEGQGLTLGLQLNAISGAPIEVLGRHPIYNRLETFILPRGSGGRTPWVTSVDLRLGFTTDLAEGYRLELAWDTFNVLAQRAVTAVDEEYTVDIVGPIPNGTTADLANLRTTRGDLARRSPNYGQPIAFQSPLAMRIGARVSF